MKRFVLAVTLACAALSSAWAEPYAIRAGEGWRHVLTLSRRVVDGVTCEGRVYLHAGTGGFHYFPACVESKDGAVSLTGTGVKVNVPFAVRDGRPASPELIEPDEDEEETPAIVDDAAPAEATFDDEPGEEE